MYWLRLIRWNNLLIILLTQFLAWWCVIVPLNGQHYDDGSGHPVIIRLLLTPVNFLLLSFSTILIAAAGYIINDYFDIRIDTINKPDKVILEKQIPRRLAIIVHSVMNGFALILAGIVAWQTRHLEFLLIQGLCTFLLWRYSTTWKRQFMIGNVIVALMTALTIIVLIIYEPYTKHLLFYNPAFEVHHPYYKYPFPSDILLDFSFFAFILTWMREIVKDMEDYKGDAEEGCETMPIRWGLKRSIRFTRILGLLALAAISFSAFFTLSVADYLTSGYIILLFVAISGWLIFISKAATKEHYHLASRYLKIIMVLGVGSLLIYRFQYG